MNDEVDIRKTVIQKGKLKQEVNKRKVFNFSFKLVLFAIAIVSIILIINSINNRGVKEEEVLSENYFIYSHDGKYGVIDKNGNVLVNAEYVKVEIPNREKAIFVCSKEYDAINNKYVNVVLNDKNEEIFKNNGNIESIISVNKYGFNTSILKYEIEGKYGILSLDGRRITNNNYDSIEELNYKDNLLLLKQNGLIGVSDLSGNIKISLNYDSIISDGYNNNGTVDYAGFIVSKDGKYGYITKDYKEMLPLEYQDVSRINTIKEDENIYLIVKYDGKYGYVKNGKKVLKTEYNSMSYDATTRLFTVEVNLAYGVRDLAGEEILPIRYDRIEYAGKYINGYINGERIVYDVLGTKQEDSYTGMIQIDNSDYFITIDRDGLYGVINDNKISVISNEYKNIQYLYDEYFIATKDGKVGILNNFGKEIVAIKYTKAEKIENANMVRLQDRDGKYYLYNKKLEKIAESFLLEVTDTNDYVEVLTQFGIYYFDHDGNSKSNKEIFSNNKIFTSEVDGKWGFVDKYGNQVIEAKYDFVTDVNKYGYATVLKNGKWSVVDKDGKELTDISYEVSMGVPSFIGRFYKTDYINYYIDFNS